MIVIFSLFFLHFNNIFVFEIFQTKAEIQSCNVCEELQKLKNFYEKTK